MILFIFGILVGLVLCNIVWTFFKWVSKRGKDKACKGDEKRGTHINVNEVVTVTLTKHGKEMAKDTSKYGKYGEAYFKLGYLSGDTYRVELWLVMRIFGESMYNGATPCFVDNLIIRDEGKYKNDRF